MKSRRYLGACAVPLCSMLGAVPVIAKVEVSLDLLVGIGVAGSAQAESIRSSLVNREAAKLRADAPLTTKLSAKASHLDSQLESSGGAFSPDRTRVDTLTLGANRLLASGTQLGADLTLKKNRAEYPQPSGPIDLSPDDEFSETTTSVFIRQSLWKDAFGQGLRRQQDGAAMAAGSVAWQVKAQIEDYAMSVISRYYNSWLAQATYQSSRQRVARQERLLKVTQVKKRRGTAEESDTLQVEAAFLKSQELASDAEKRVNDLWRELTIHLGLTGRYRKTAGIDVVLHPADRVSIAKVACKQKPNYNTPALQAVNAQITAAEHRLAAAKSQAQPDLYLEGRLTANGIDDATGRTVGESLSGKHPQLTLSVGLEWPLGFDREQADYLDSFASKLNLEASRLSTKLQIEVDWTNECIELARLTKKREQLQSVLTMQQRRVELEEKRFTLGQVDVNNVILAGNDVTTAEFDVRNAEMDLQLSAWKISKLHGQLNGYIRQAVATVQKMIPHEQIN